MKSSFLLFILSLVLGMAEFGHAAPTDLSEEPPVEIKKLDPNTIIVDFGRVTFGNIALKTQDNQGRNIVVHFGEALKDGRVDRNPGGTIRYSQSAAVLSGDSLQVFAPPIDARNTEVDATNHPPAILTPSEWGVITPFRWVEIEGWQGELAPDDIVRRSVYLKAWDDEAAAFQSSDDMFNQIWDLSRHSIKATSFAGVYVDGDRERIPYEADAYLNQLSHYATDNDIEMARDTYDHLMQHGTWPSEWAPHMVFMAYADWRHTGDAEWLRPRFEALKTKLLLERRGRDGLIYSNRKQVRRIDIVDWPKAERDGFVFTKVNTVVNAFHIRAMMMMAELAEALELNEDASELAASAEETSLIFQSKLFDPDAGLYRDGVKTTHSSVHANLFPLAFGLVPNEHRDSVTEWLEAQGMKCSVYAAQYLLEGLFENGAGDTALALITAPGDRSWRHFVDSGATITWEAWDIKYKPNLDWNHAWGAAPANLLPRYVLGASPLSPGWHTTRIRPVTGDLKFAKGKVPTPRGAILIDWENDEAFSISITLPDGVSAQVELPIANAAQRAYINGAPVASTVSGDRLILDEILKGSARIEIR